MNYATIKYCDIANGTGVRTSLFVSGCRRHCPECFNAVAWDFGYGLPFDKAVRNEILGSLAPDYIDGLSLLGGEPFEPENQRALVPFLHEVRVLYPHKTIWCYTGNVYETELLQPSHARCEVTDEMLSLIDVLVDGEFIPAQHDISLRFRGSGNQRIIDLNATRAAVEEGVVAGGGTIFVNVIPAVEALLNTVEGDEKTGVQIIVKALQEPIRQIAANAGIDGSVVLEKIKTSGKVGYGFDAYKEVYCDMISAGIVDPAKVTRSALENAASVSSMVLTTEALVADKPEPPAPAAPGAGMGDMGGMY